MEPEGGRHHSPAAEFQAAEPAVEAQPAAQKVPSAASFAELTGEPAVASGSKAEPAKAGDELMTNTDALIEQLAHGMVDRELGAKEEHFLQVNGYQALPITAASTSS